MIARGCDVSEIRVTHPRDGLTDDAQRVGVGAILPMAERFQTGRRTPERGGAQQRARQQERCLRFPGSRPCVDDDTLWWDHLRNGGSSKHHGGQGRDRTVDLPIFSRTLVPTELPGQQVRISPN